MSSNNFKFIILGAGRGGTSLLAGLLDYNSKLEVGFELHSVSYLMGKELSHLSSNLFDERIKSFMTACQETANQFPDKFWGNKITTEHVFSLEKCHVANPELKTDVLDIIFNTYLPSLKIIFIIRDGRTCINSKVQRTGQAIETAAARWKYSVTCYKFFKQCHRNNLCIRYEDLLSQPEKKLTEICNFLDVPFQDEMLLGTNNKKMLPEYRRNDIDRVKMDMNELPNHIFATVREDLEYCGYL